MNKFKKIALKFIATLPLGLLVSFIIHGFQLDDNNVVFIIILGVISSCAYLIPNVIAYSKIEDISLSDYLESRHKVVLPNDSRILEMISVQSMGAFSDVTLTDDKIDLEYRLYEINNEGYGSYLKVDYGSDNIELSIESKFMGFFPDRAKNYRIITRLKNEADRLTTTTKNRK